MFKINKNIIICGIVKNCADKINFNINLAIKTGELFNTYKIIVYENNSTDSTKKVLNQYVSNNKITIITEDIEDKIIKQTSKIWSYKEITGSDHPCRIEQIANARNKVIQEYNKLEYDAFDYIIWIDFDSNGWSLDGIINSFNKTEIWDVIYANGLDSNKYYYDLYALRGINTYLGPEIIGEYFWKTLKNNIKLNEETLIPVYSAFGGIGIFKKEIFKKYNYDCIVNNAVKVFYRNFIKNNILDKTYINIIKNKDSKFPYGYLDEENNNIFYKSNSGYDNTVVCEHVCLNFELYNNGYKIFINPKMIYLH
jgi:hypothetical protein